MNSFYINIADKIGNDVATPGIPVLSGFSNINTYTTACINYYENHDSIASIKMDY